MFVDTHCHLNHEQFSGDVAPAIARAVDAGVERMIVVGFDVASSFEAVRLAQEYEPVFAAVAIHPHDARNFDRSAGSEIRKMAEHPKVVAIGEIGLDYHYDFSPVEDQ